MTTINAAGTCNGLVLTLEGTYSSELEYELTTLETENNWETGTGDTLRTLYTDGYKITSTQALLTDGTQSVDSNHNGLCFGIVRDSFTDEYTVQDETTESSFMGGYCHTYQGSGDGSFTIGLNLH